MGSSRDQILFFGGKIAIFSVILMYFLGRERIILCSYQQNSTISHKSQAWVEVLPYIDYLNKEIKGLQGPNSTFGVCETLKPWNFEIILNSFESSH